MGTARKLKRQIQKNNGTLPHKKVIAKKLGCTVKEVDDRLRRREQNLKELEGNKDGKE
ncbi:MAG: hypothetical protein NC307_12315 [Roseburia sp.]|nr:hypothetical protein [Roseburia sp.]